MSEEYILECTNASDCGGGYVNYAMTLSLSGMTLDATYPYLASNFGEVGRPANGICNTTNTITAAGGTVTVYNNVTDTALKTMLVNAPIPALIDADAGFQAYSSGTYACPGTPNMTVSSLNHAIQLIGYDSNGNYLIKNSWGTTWGVNGFGTVNSSLDCGIKQVVFQFVTSTPSIITLNTTVTNNSTNNSTTNSTNHNLKSGWKIAFMFALAFFTLIVTA